MEKKFELEERFPIQNGVILFSLFGVDFRKGLLLIEVTKCANYSLTIVTYNYLLL